MTDEQISGFTRRISQSNRSELIVIMYDMFFAYAEDAKANQDNLEEYVAAIRGAEAVLDRLMKSLDFSYEVSKELYALYQYVMRQLSVAMYKNKWDEAVPGVRVMEKLLVAFQGVAASDTSEPLMKNAERVVAGMTYGRGSLVEDYIDSGSNRGFLA